MTVADAQFRSPRFVHVLAELAGCDPKLLDDREVVEAALRDASAAADATVLEIRSHRFEPHGVTGVALLAESHVAVHTWPEHRHAILDVLSCGPTMRPDSCVETMAVAFEATTVDITSAENSGTSFPGWFTERALPFGRPGVQVGIYAHVLLHDERTRWGHIQILDTPFYGRMLVIDGIVQTTINDEFIYHEMLTLPAALRHGGPRTMLIIGGGDGGALRQAVRLRSLDRIVQVEIDEAVTRSCRTYLPEISGGAFDDHRVHLVFGDGAEYLSSSKEKFDIIVLDLTDPVPQSPAEPLFEADFLARVRDALTPGGVVAAQCGSLSIQPAEVATQKRRFQQTFAETALHTAFIPGYQLSTFGFLVASAAPLAHPAGTELAERWRNISGHSRYLSPEVYAASTVLPPYLRQAIGL